MVSRTLARLDAWIVEAEKLLAEQLEYSAPDSQAGAQHVESRSSGPSIWVTCDGPYAGLHHSTGSTAAGHGAGTTSLEVEE